MSEAKTAEIRLERVSLKDVRPHPRNPRNHPPVGSQAWEALRASLEHDYFDPIVVNRRTNLLVSGHLRHKVLLDAGYQEADASIVDYDEPTHLARMIAANNQFGEFAKELLGPLATAIDEAQLDASLAGWLQADLDKLIQPPAVQDDTQQAAELVSRAEELQRIRQVQEGDLFAIGNHRLICGDSLERSNWDTLLSGDSIGVIWTDPPYNVDYDPANGARGKVASQKLLNDSLAESAYAELLHGVFAVLLEFARPGAAIYVAHADSHGLSVRSEISRAGWRISQNLVWVKNAWTLSRSDYQWQHEPILYGWKPGAAHHWQGGFDQATVIDDEEKDLSRASKPELIAIIQRLRNDRETTVIREPRTPSGVDHPTIKPLPLVARQVWNSSRRGDVVADAFPGSGTTIVAAERTDRRCIAVEKDPKYCAVILQRLEELGLKAEKVDAYGSDHA